ncbi:hypothetical protein HOI26_02610 [Candidatus Woesearchaeota archaeon]|nr:hypothetical protein [Candidatus Woesearchaeota archaeon]MBT5739969.1 hypothetical protein [Candidatus Woesearchaeota archaeon]
MQNKDITDRIKKFEFNGTHGEEAVQTAYNQITSEHRTRRANQLLAHMGTDRNTEVFDLYFAIRPNVAKEVISEYSGVKSLTKRVTDRLTKDYTSRAVTKAAYQAAKRSI